MKHICILPVILAIASYVCGDEDRLIGFRSIDYALNASNSVSIGVKTTSESAYALPLHLESVEFVWDGARMAVPTNILSEVTFPRLDTLEIRAGAYWGGVNDSTQYRHLCVSFRDPRPRSEARIQGQFLFWGESFRKFSICYFTGPFCRDCSLAVPADVWTSEGGFAYDGQPYPDLRAILDAMDKKAGSRSDRATGDPFEELLPGTQEENANKSPPPVPREAAQSASPGIR